MNTHQIRSVLYSIISFLSIIFSSSLSFGNDAAIMAKIEGYLNSWDTITANFIQIGPEQNMRRVGIMYIKKPGQLKFEYITPKKITVINDNNNISYYDHEMEELSQIQDDQALASLLTQKNIVVSQVANIISLVSQNEEVELVINKREPGSSDHYPYLAVKFFNKDVLKLKSVLVINDESAVTEIMFSDLVVNCSIPDSIFKFKDPHFFGLED